MDLCHDCQKKIGLINEENKRANIYAPTVGEKLLDAIVEFVAEVGTHE
jgi:hypothetical protein